MGFALTPVVAEQGQAIATLSERLAFAHRDIEQLNVAIKAEREAIHLLDKRTVAIETQVDELRRSVEESDRRRWTLVVAAVGVILSLIANVVVTLIRR